ncbi:MAG TPA: hypothetical protein DIT64_18465 [Verrucomicrobiales bacterium]|nr:hypothetical protein [Verrucomicrobiales bacterium]
MKTALSLTLAALLLLAVLAGIRLAGPGARPLKKEIETVATAPVRPPPLAPGLPPAQAVEVPLQVLDAATAPPRDPVAAILERWSRARTPQEHDEHAEALAALGTVEAVQALMEKLARVRDAEARGLIAANLRAIAEPDTLAALVPALLGDFRQGSPELRELCSAIGRLAQAETVQALEDLHWHAASLAGQSPKVVRAMASIRNPAAARGLEKLVARGDAAESLTAAAREALMAMGLEPPQPGKVD